jgi:regulatory protein
MTVVSIKTGTGAELRRIELSDGSLFSFKTCYLPPVFIDESLYTPGLAEGREISADEEGGFRFASACLRAEKAALRMIARAEQSVWGLTRKLEKRGHEAACVNAVISRLIDLKLVDDCRFARLWLETRQYRARSPRRLLVRLRARGVDRDDADAALKTVLTDEIEWALLQRFTVKWRRSRAFRRLANAQGGVSMRTILTSLKITLRNEGFSTAAIQRYLDEEESHAAP